MNFTPQYTTSQAQNSFMTQPRSSYNQLKILYWNARSINRHKEELIPILKDIDIFVCVETWLKEENKIEFSGFNCYRKDRRHSRGGGILILLRKNLFFTERTNLIIPDDSVEISSLKITNVHPILNLIVCYRIPGFNLSQDKWNQIVSNTAQVSTNCLFMGDFNAHHVVWNCTQNDANGEKLLQAIDDHNLFLHNTNTLSHIDFYRAKKSNLDLILSSNALADKITVEINDETWGSDHFPIFVTMSAEKNLYHKKSFRIYSLRTEWEEVSKLLENAYPEFLSHTYTNLSASQKYKKFIEIITQAVKTNTPVKKTVNPIQHRNPVPWWDSECDQLKKQRKEAYKKWDRTYQLEDLIKYKKAVALVKKVFKRKKKESFREFSETINFRTNRTYTWNKCKIFKNKWINTQTACSTNNNKPNENQVNEALNKISPPWVPTDPSFLPDCTDNEFFDEPFDFVEFNIAADARKKKSAPGRYGIDYLILQKLPIKYKLILLDIFNEIYREKEYPAEWKQSYVHLIKKSDGKSLRPITLTSCTCKLFESLLKNRLQWWCENHNLIPKSQTGFRRGQSCVDNLCNLTTSIEEGLQIKKDTLAAFLDVQGAFDNVICEILLTKLASIGCSKRVIVFIKFLLYERIISCESLGEVYRLGYKGVPQGGVISPLLYILYASHIITNLPKNLTILQFADDIVIYAKIVPLNRCKNLIEKSIGIIKDNLRSLGLELSAQKTVFIHFNRNKHYPGATEIKIDDVVIKSSYSTKFLGIIFDYQLTFTDHINYVQKKCTKALNIIKFLCGTWWGSDPETLIILYKKFHTITHGLWLIYLFPNT